MMSDEDLCYLSATEALGRFKARKLSPVELMQAVIARAEKVEPKINAFPIKHYDRALDQAKAAEAKYMKTDGRVRPLEGLPVAIKDEAYVKGERVTFGSLIYKDFIADATNPSIGRILKAGAIMHARSATPEFSCAPWTHSRLWGITRTPWNLQYSCGGSSGGSGAGLAAGLAPLASGSDIGGSIRIPASMCGVVGFKPPFGRNPDDTPFNLDQYCHIGPMARTVADCALLQNVMSGPHPADIVSLRPKLRIPAALGDIKGWRIALCVNPAQYDIEPDVTKNTLAAAELLRDAGATVEEVDLGWKRDDVVAAAAAHFGTIFAPQVARSAKKHRKIMTDYALDFADWSKATRKEDYLKGLEIETAMYKSLGALFQKYRILLCPTLPLPATKAGESYVKRKLHIDGKPQATISHWLMTICFNIMSRCPVMSMPSGLAANGVPTGLSIVGRTYDDVSVFRAAAAFERARPWYTTPALRPKL
jgi:Asp-tRNA(Asn)/Glu-tRNA(Gln) amidotransferase A subunit family amidase